MNRKDYSHYRNTPTIIVRDNRGLGVRDISYHRHPDTPALTDERITRHQFNALGQHVLSIDPRLFENQQAEAAGKPNFTYRVSLTGEVLRTDSVDAGSTLTLNDIDGRALLKISPTGVICRWQYEEAPQAGRLLSISEQGVGEQSRITERFVWAGDSQAEKDLNLAGQCVRHYDTAGRSQTDSIGLTRAALSVTRQLLNQCNQADWQGADESAWEDLLVPGLFTTTCFVDATGTLLRQVDAQSHLQRQAYDVAGLLIGSWLTPKDGTEQVILKSLAYSAAGQKLREEHGNGVVTTYSYEPQTQRLTGIRTERPAGHASGSKMLQDLRYDYDPVGNVLSLRNDAEATRFWRNQKVVPENRYVYDSLYQLVTASGREMADIAQQGTNLPSATIPLPTNDGAYTLYTRSYRYDRGGNLTQLCHYAAATNNSYTTNMTVSERSNRAVLSTLTEDPTQVDALFDAGGHQRQLQPGQPLSWTPRGELAQVTPVVREGRAADHETYRYDASSQRLEKLSSQQTGHSTQTQRVLYLPGLELRTRQSGDAVKETLHIITVGKAGRAQVRMLHWETGTPDGISNDSLLYSYDNLIGSSGLELDERGQVISQEEYYPYGGTAVWAARSQAEASYKTVRYSGKERDATGLYYYGYRYYQPWVGRWLSADPAGTVDGLNLYRMVRNNPISGYDINGLMFRAVSKVLVSVGAAAATLAYESNKHANIESEPAQSSLNTFGNDKIHNLNKDVIEKRNNFSVREKVKENLSGRGRVITDLFTKGELPAHESIINQKDNLATLLEFSQTGSIEQLDKSKLVKASISDAANNLPERLSQAVKGFRTVTSVSPEGMLELKQATDRMVENVKDTVAVGASVGLAGNAVLTTAKIIVPGAAIPISIAQVVWAASSAGKIVNQVNGEIKKNMDSSPISHDTRAEAFRQMEEINANNRGKPFNKVIEFLGRQ